MQKHTALVEDEQGWQAGRQAHSCATWAVEHLVADNKAQS